MEEITMYKCSKCKKIHNEKFEAVDCEISHFTVLSEDYTYSYNKGYPEIISVSFIGGETKTYFLSDDNNPTKVEFGYTK